MIHFMVFYGYHGYMMENDGGSEGNDITKFKWTEMNNICGILNCSDVSILTEIFFQKQQKHYLSFIFTFIKK